MTQRKYISSSALYNLIYEAAKSNNKLTLEQLIASGTSLDLHKGLFPPITQLAQEGLHEAVNLLISFGADINFAILGYAMSGEDDHVSALIKLGGNANFAVAGYAACSNHDKVALFLHSEYSLQLAICMYARNKDYKAVNRLLAQGGSKTFVIRGFALGLFHPEVEALLRSSDPELLIMATIAYAEIGARNKVEEMLERGAPLKAAIIGYALGGFYQYADEILFREKDIKEKSILELRQIEALAKAGHVLAVQHIISRKGGAAGPYIKVALGGYAEGKHLKQITPFSKSLENYAEYALVGLTTASLHGEVEELLKRHKKNHPATVVGYASSFQLNSKENALSTLSSFNDPEIREQLAKTAQKIFNLGKENGQPVTAIYPKMRSLLPLAQEIHHIRKDNHFSFHQSLAWQDLSLRVWLLQGIQLVKQGKLTSALYFRITKEIFPMSTHELHGLIERAQFKRQVIWSITHFLKNRYNADKKLFRDDRIKTLAIDCSKAQSVEQLKSTLVTKAVSLFQSNKKKDVKLHGTINTAIKILKP